MHYNEDYPSQIMAISKEGTNSTMFTDCCTTAITDQEANCPRCGRKVIGWNMTPDERRRARWKNATRYWK